MPAVHDNDGTRLAPIGCVNETPHLPRLLHNPLHRHRVWRNDGDDAPRADNVPKTDIDGSNLHALLQILHLFPHLLDQQFEFHRRLRYDAGHGLGTKRVGFAVEFLHQEIEALSAGAAGLQHARGLQDWSALAGGLENALRDLRLAAGNLPSSPPGGNARLRWNALAPEGVPEAGWLAALARLQAALAGGDDYELLFTAAPGARQAVLAAAAAAQTPVARAGRVTRAEAAVPASIFLRAASGALRPLPAEARGFDHFAA